MSPRTDRRADGRARGFSLLELLIAITLLGFILTLLFAVFRTSQRSWDAAEQRIEEVSRMQTARRFLDNTLTRAYPFAWKKLPEKTLAFAGQPQRLDFITELPAHLGGGGLQQVTLAVETVEGNEGVQQLVFRNAPLDREAAGFPPAAAGEAHVIVEQARGIRFSYYGPEPSALDKVPVAPSRWSGEWLNAKRLPKMVRIEIDTDPAWPDLFIVPMTAQEGGCVWDDFYKRCRPGT